MTTLYPAQESHAREIYRSLVSRSAALDTSETGTGKTIMAAHIARHWAHAFGYPVVVVCPKSVITSWNRALQAHDVEPLYVGNYEKLRNGVDGVVKLARKWKTNKGKPSEKTHKSFKWEVPKDTLIIFDEVHYCRQERGQTGNLLIAATKQGIPRLMLSATAAQDPTEMRALGYALSLHDLDDMTGNNSYRHWQRRHGCVKDPFSQFRLMFPKHADTWSLNHELFEETRCAHGISTSDLPGAFKHNRVIPEYGDYSGAAYLYEQAGVTADVVGDLVADIQSRDSDAPVTDLLRARQAVEAIKVTHFIEQTNELLREGKSVVSFFNFRESIDLYRKAFPESGWIVGGQDDRQEILDAWAEDKIRVLAVQSQAGGTGVSLHDVRGEFPRVSLISPDFSPYTFKQVLGRIPRVGMKTPTVQKILIAAGTVEEHVFQICSKGVDNMDTMMGT